MDTGQAVGNFTKITQISRKYRLLFRRIIGATGSYIYDITRSDASPLSLVTTTVSCQFMTVSPTEVLILIWKRSKLNPYVGNLGRPLLVPQSSIWSPMLNKYPKFHAHSAYLKCSHSKNTLDTWSMLHCLWYLGSCSV